jgi:hypothetical protein
MSTHNAEDTGLKRSLRQRHMTMISLGGVIGAGLFVGSGAVMNKTGPAAVATCPNAYPTPPPPLAPLTGLRTDCNPLPGASRERNGGQDGCQYGI